MCRINFIHILPEICDVTLIKSVFPDTTLAAVRFHWSYVYLLTYLTCQYHIHFTAFKQVIIHEYWDLSVVCAVDVVRRRWSGVACGLGVKLSLRVMAGLVNNRVDLLK